MKEHLKMRKMKFTSFGQENKFGLFPTLETSKTLTFSVLKSVLIYYRNIFYSTLKLALI